MRDFVMSVYFIKKKIHINRLRFSYNLIDFIESEGMCPGEVTHFESAHGQRT